MAFYFNRPPRAIVAKQTEASFPLLDLPMSLFLAVVERMDRATFQFFAKSSLADASLCSVPPAVQEINMSSWWDMNTKAMSSSRIFCTDLAKYAKPYTLPFPGAVLDPHFTIDLFSLGWNTQLAALHSFTLVVVAESKNVGVSLIGRCRHGEYSPQQRMLQATEDGDGKISYSSDILPEHSVIQIQSKKRPDGSLPKYSVFLSLPIQRPVQSSQ